ncbi:MAG: hypothetical protein ACO331_09005 [Prochlorothrix sp.]
MVLILQLPKVALAADRPPIAAVTLALVPHPSTPGALPRDRP